MEAQEILQQLETLSPEERQAVETVIKSMARKTDAEAMAAKRRSAWGALKGNVIYMAPDFDEPLEDFKDYM